MLSGLGIAPAPMATAVGRWILALAFAGAPALAHAEASPSEATKAPSSEGSRQSGGELVALVTPSECSADRASIRRWRATAHRTRIPTHIELEVARAGPSYRANLRTRSPRGEGQIELPEMDCDELWATVSDYVETILPERDRLQTFAGVSHIWGAFGQHSLGVGLGLRYGWRIWAVEVGLGYARGQFDAEIASLADEAPAKIELHQEMLTGAMCAVPRTPGRSFYLPLCLGAELDIVHAREGTEFPAGYRLGKRRDGVLVAGTAGVRLMWSPVRARPGLELGIDLWLSVPGLSKISAGASPRTDGEFTQAESEHANRGVGLRSYLAVHFDPRVLGKRRRASPDRSQ